MRSALFGVFLFVAACQTPQAARWDVDVDKNVAVARCPNCAEAVSLDETRCPHCGQAYTIEEKTIACSHCGGTGKAPLGPLCESCQDSGRCPICEGTGVFEGEVCPECGGKKTCPDCAAGKEPPPLVQEECPYCLGTGEIELGPR